MIKRFYCELHPLRFLEIYLFNFRKKEVHYPSTSPKKILTIRWVFILEADTVIKAQ